MCTFCKDDTHVKQEFLDIEKDSPFKKLIKEFDNQVNNYANKIEIVENRLTELIQTAKEEELNEAQKKEIDEIMKQFAEVNINLAIASSFVLKSQEWAVKYRKDVRYFFKETHARFDEPWYKKIFRS